jgi:predicted aconitase
MGADRLIPIESAHIDGALYHGDSGTLFAERLVAGGARTAVRATLNVGAIDLTGCSRNRLASTRARNGPAHDDRVSTARMRIDVDLRAVPGRSPAAAGKPGRLGRIERGRILQFRSWRAHQSLRRFLDIACAISGRAPDYGLHRTENRRATVVFDLSHVDRSSSSPTSPGRCLATFMAG